MMHRITLYLALLFMMLSVLPFRAQAETISFRKMGVVIHLSHFMDDPQAVVRALDMGTLLAGKGNKVVLFLDGEGVRLADQRVKDIQKWNYNEMTLPDMYGAFVKAGGRVLLEPRSAEMTLLTSGDLRSGASIGAEDTVANMIMNASKILDY